MKAIILAAGVGSRMGKYTNSLPKGMIKINGKTLIERQIQVLEAVGINNIVIVTGYNSEMINYKGVNYYHNKNYQNTNMIESLMCAKSEFDQDLIITYADLIYTEDLMRRLIDNNQSVSVCVDSDWKNYWYHRYGTIETDLESLTIKSGKITELGSPVQSSEGIDYRYIGVVKFSTKIIPAILSIYEKKKKHQIPWAKSGNTFMNGYMTDFLYEMIINDIIVHPVMGDKQWIEIDTASDYESLSQDYKSGDIEKYYSGSLK